MKPSAFEYHTPTSIEQACQLIASLDNAKVLAGGQSLMAMLNLRFVYPDHLIDINKVAGLDGISIEGSRMRIGAMTRQRALEIDPSVKQAAPIFAEALAVVGHRQTRNRGTLGGSLCHLDPAAELPLLALLYDATIHVTAAGGRSREIGADAFVAGFMTPGIAPDELVTRVDFPLWPLGHGYAFVERARRHGDFAIASAGCLLQADASGRVTRAALGIGGLASVPVRLGDGETDLIGTTCDADAIERAAHRCASLDAHDDFHGRAGYRRSVAAEVLRIAIRTAYARQREASR